MTDSPRSVWRRDRSIVFNEMELDEENGQVMKEEILGNRRGVASLGWGRGRIKWGVLEGLSSTEVCR